MPGRFNIKQTLMRIWDAPDRFRLMDPLPSFHRKGILIAALVVILCVLWPSAPSIPPRTPEPAPLNQDVVQPQPAAPASPTTTEAPTAQAPSSGQAPAPFQENDIEQQWRSYRVDSGKTLAQLFRDHDLPAEDVYAMAKVEGDGKPLSNLQSGQMVQVRQNANGVVTALTVDLGNNAQVLFTRQPDGSFLRVR